MHEVIWRIWADPFWKLMSEAQVSYVSSREDEEEL